MSTIFAFEEFELDEQRFELRCRGKRVNVQPKVLRLLFYLVTQRHRSVANEELFATLWPDATVSAASIKRAMRGARQALGDRGDSQTIIRTVRGHGYQFILPVRELAQPDSSSNAASSNRTDGTASTGPPGTSSACRGEGDGFVGREGVLSLLEDALFDAVSGRGRCMLIVGEPGIGKTRTLLELARRAKARGARAWLGRCQEVEGAPAYWPVIQILRRCAEDFDITQLGASMGGGAADIAEAVPELKTWLPDLPSAPAIGSVSARFRFFDSLAELFKRVAERQPLVLLLDDLQRADQPSLRLLLFLMRQIDTMPVLLAGTARAPDVGAMALLADIAKEPSTGCIELEGLSRADLVRYVRLYTGFEAPQATIDVLHERTAGNPLFLEQLLRGVRGDSESAVGPPRWDELTRTPLPHGLRGAIEHHLEILDTSCLRLLRVAAVLGRDFSATVLAQMTGTGMDSALKLLSASGAAGLVQASGTLGEYRFTHALIREALYDQLPLSERARLHGSAGRVFEARGVASDALLPVLTEHFVRAAPTHDEGRALRYSLRSARAAMQRMAYEEAALHFERALQVLALGEGDPRQRMELLLAKGEAMAHAGVSEAARPALLEATMLAHELHHGSPGHGRPLASSSDSVDVLVRAATLLARLPESGTIDAVRVRALEQALSALPGDDTRRACLEALLAKSLSYARAPSQSARVALSALQRARTLAEPRPRARALHGCVEALAAPDYLRERQAIAEELLRVGHEHNDHEALLHAWSTQVWNCVELGDMVGADIAIDTLESLAQHVREPFFRWHALAFRAMRALVQGKLESCEQLALRGRKLGTLVGDTTARHAYRVQLHGVRMLQGRFKEAETIARDVSAQLPALAGWRAVLAGHEADAGRKAQARATLERLMEHDLRALHSDPFVLSALAPAAELCVRVGDAASARSLYDAILPYEDHHANVSFGLSTHGPIARHLGLLAVRSGDLKRAERHFERAIASAERMPSPPFLCLSYLAHARLLLKSDRAARHAQAAQQLTRVRQLAENLDLQGILHLCRRLTQSANLTLESSAQA